MMKKNKFIFTVITIIVCIVPVIAGALLYDRLPNEMAIHFNMNNQPNNYASKDFVLFGIPIMMTVFQLIMCSINWFAKKKMEKEPKIFVIVETIIPVITIVLYYLTVSYSLDNSINIGKSVCLMLGILFCVLGNYFPKMSYESNKEFIHPKPKNEKSFRKMVKISGYSTIGMGIIFLIIMFFI